MYKIAESTLFAKKNSLFLLSVLILLVYENDANLKQNNDNLYMPC